MFLIIINILEPLRKAAIIRGFMSKHSISDIWSTAFSRQERILWEHTLCIIFVCRNYRFFVIFYHIYLFFVIKTITLLH